MSLPIPEPKQPEQNQAGSISDLDSLLSELSAPKEEIKRSPMDPPQGDIPGAVPDPAITLTPEMAAASGKAIAGTIDTVLATGFSLYGKQEREKYEATDKEMSKLNEAWAAVAAKYNYKVEDSPWFNVILLTIAIYLPTWQEAQKDHRFAAMEERLKAIEMKQKEHEAMIEAKTIELNPQV